MTIEDFPKDTAEFKDSRGYPHVGHIVEHAGVDQANGLALYYFPGDFVAGDGFEAWLDPVTARDGLLLQDYMTEED